MWTKFFGFILVLVLLSRCGTSNSTCKSNCSKDALACLLIISDSTPTFSNKMIGFLFCDSIKNSCIGKCSGGSGSSSGSSRSSSSSGSRSSGGGSSSGGGGSSGGSGGSSHEISPPF